VSKRTGTGLLLVVAGYCNAAVHENDRDCFRDTAGAEILICPVIVGTAGRYPKVLAEIVMRRVVQVMSVIIVKRVLLSDLVIRGIILIIGSKSGFFILRNCLRARDYAVTVSINSVVTIPIGVELCAEPEGWRRKKLVI